MDTKKRQWMRKKWRNMINRCKEDSPFSHRYYNRGITVCERWAHSFDAFLQDMGYPTGDANTIERVNNDKGYYKENCKWATQREQSLNKGNSHKVTHNGETVCVSQLAERLGKKQNSVLAQIRRGWTIEEIVAGKREKDSKSTVAQHLAEIIQLRNSGVGIVEIGERFGVDGSTISRALKGAGYDGAINAATSRCQRNREEALSLLANGMTVKDVASSLGVSQSTVYSLKRKGS